MSTILIVLALVVFTALAFDFTNGFHDTANAMATSVATGALKPFTAVLIAAVLNLVGAFLSVNVAATVAKGIVNLENMDMTPDASGVPAQGIPLLMVVFSGLIGAILWNLFTWLLGLPSSSSHALFGGLIGSAFGAMGTQGVAWTSILGHIIIPAFVAPFVAGLISAFGTAMIYWLTNTIPNKLKNDHFRHGQVVTACLVSLAHGSSDAQKTMGVIFLAMVAAGEINSTDRIPLWIIASCAFAIALGTVSGGWRIMRTLGKGLVEIESPQGMAAESASAAIILTSAAGGMALSTTHVATGSILGTGLGRRGAKVRWGVAMRMASAWIITLPCAAMVGFATWWIAVGVGQLGGPLLGAVVNFAILAVMSGWIFFRSQRNKIDPSNVNADWNEDSENTDSSIAAVDKPEPATAGAAGSGAPTASTASGAAN
ncbi:inorganic phosphate transporter [Corynebacterium doosanense]|uniref:Phosphate transporter n=1 Tax=Corynebacterium doosanense CAU 212 = DSM 45436 TaxID=558173 RepID=A0A097IFU9_9CORY|nr:inorganic phosphate transporter [Corynebacterium doosanense]AIT61005.1 inorganic phosphate transporter [Corynebacterium doosanense CAU 212 = DSM 45436]